MKAFQRTQTAAILISLENFVICYSYCLCISAEYTHFSYNTCPVEQGNENVNMPFVFPFLWMVNL